MPTTSKNKQRAKELEKPEKPKTPVEKRDQMLLEPKMIQGYWDKFFKANSYDAERHGREALDWFRQRVSKDLDKSAMALLADQKDYKSFDPYADRSLVGRLYLFQYAAEIAGDQVTGTYDRFPMVFFFNYGKTKSGHSCLWGLNMHYLTPANRALLYRKLMELKAGTRWTAKEKLKLSWELIKGVAGHPIAERAVHAYRVDRIKSRMLEIHPQSWIVAVFLRLEVWLKPKTHESGGYASDLRAKHRQSNRSMFAKT